MTHPSLSPPSVMFDLARFMKRLIIKAKDRLFPTVIWKRSSLVVYYLGENEEDVEVRESQEIDFDEFFLHLDRGGSVFVTIKPQSGKTDHGVFDESDEIYGEPLWNA